eukprot:3938930-Amphidinium_carterae.1
MSKKTLFFCKRRVGCGGLWSLRRVVRTWEQWLARSLRWQCEEEMDGLSAAIEEGKATIAMLSQELHCAFCFALPFAMSWSCWEWSPAIMPGNSRQSFLTDFRCVPRSGLCVKEVDDFS